MSIDRKLRDSYHDLLACFLKGGVTNDEVLNSLELLEGQETSDKLFVHLNRALYLSFEDIFESFTFKDVSDDPMFRSFLNRVMLFLESNLEYEAPSTGSIYKRKLARLLQDIVTWFCFSRTMRDLSNQFDDYWPFKTKVDFEKIRDKFLA